MSVKNRNHAVMNFLADHSAVRSAITATAGLRVFLL